jgi:hypothetical protein
MAENSAILNNPESLLTRIPCYNNTTEALIGIERHKFVPRQLKWRLLVDGKQQRTPSLSGNFLNFRVPQWSLTLTSILNAERLFMAPLCVIIKRLEFIISVISVRKLY